MVNVIKDLIQEKNQLLARIEELEKDKEHAFCEVQYNIFYKTLEWTKLYGYTEYWYKDYEENSDYLENYREHRDGNWEKWKRMKKIGEIIGDYKCLSSAYKELFKTCVRLLKKEEKLEQTKSENARLTARVAELERDNEIYLEALELGGQKRNREIRERDIKIKLLEKQIRCYKKYAKTLTENFVKKDNKLSQQLTQAQQQKEEEKKQKTKINSKYQLLKENIKKLNQRKKEIIRELAEEKITVNNLITTKNQLSQELNQQTENLKEKNILIDNQQAEIILLNSQITQLEKDKIHLTEQLTNEQEQNQQKLQEKEGTYNSLNTLYNKEKADSKNTIESLKVELANQAKKSNKQKKVIQELKAEKKELLNKQKELLIEISLLKNPPINQTNKENIQIKTEKYQKQVEALVEKLPPKQVEIINLIWKEQKEKLDQKVEKINHLETQMITEREREQKVFLLNPRFGTSDNNCFGKDSIIN